MHLGSSIQVTAAAVSLLLSVGAIAWGLHRVLNRIERSLKSTEASAKKAEGHTRELVNNGGSSMKDELTVGRGGMVDRQMRMEQQVEVLVDALTTVRTRLEAADETLNGKVDQVRRDVGSLNTSLGLHIEVANQQTAIIGTALAGLGAEVHLTPGPRDPQQITRAVVIPLAPNP